MDSMLTEFEKVSGIQIALITLDTSMVMAQDLDALTERIARTWGVGDKKTEKGIMIGLSKGNRRIRISNGAGITTILSDLETKNLIDTHFIPHYKEGKYFEGTWNGLQALIKELSD